MNPKHNRILTSLSLLAFVISLGETSIEAQQLHTSSANQAQHFGEWDPPSNADQNTVPQPSTDRFRNLFPPGNLKPNSGQRSSTFAPAQEPAPMMRQPPKARPLQPINQNQFLQGSFSREPHPGGDFAHVTHHEASSAEAVMPLPNAGFGSSWPEAPSKIDKLAESGTTGSISGLVGSIQSGSKNLLSQFQANGGWGEKISGIFGSGDNQFRKVFGSLAVIIGGYLAFVWLMRKFNLSANRRIPSEVIEVIGSAPFGPRKNLQLVRLGSKLLLLMNGPEGTHPVGEITDAEEVNHLISLCSGKRSRASRSVMSAVRQIGQRPSSNSPSARTVQPTMPAPTENTFSTADLVQALEAIKGSNRSNTVFEA